ANVRGVSFSGAMHSVLPVDGEGRPLGRALTWADGRPGRWANHLREHEDALGTYTRTGTPPFAMSPLAKLRWIHEERPDLARAARFVSVKEYVTRALCGEWAVDHSVASATGLMDARLLDWDPEALRLARVTPERLSPLVSPLARLPRLLPDMASATGLRPDTPLVIGGNDGALANLGSHATAGGVAAVSLGTSGAV
ncbi:FGGY family carbohydrate kinase, partial [Deinococcus pimensis]|uniref:FGGY family carbohydrate kinase n=1 Tax=Deinococcus pimensis TaxID=309888 RepID=UPI001B7F9039